MKFKEIFNQELRFYRKQKSMAEDRFQRSCYYAKKRGDYMPPEFGEAGGYLMTKQEIKESNYYGIISCFFKIIKRWMEERKRQREEREA